MSFLSDEFRGGQLFKPALIVPSLIMLIFSLFNLTAAMDPERSAAAFHLGVVNMDKGLTFPPIKVASRVLDGLGDTLPFQVSEFDAKEPAKAALEAGQVGAVIVFAEDFSKNAISGGNFSIEVLNTQHLTVVETQIAAQLPMMIQMAMSAGVSNLRLAMASGEIPTAGFAVTAKVETLHKAANSATLMAPFVMVFATWLAAMVGAMLLFLASRDLADGRQKATIRTVFPVLSLGLASLVLSLVVAATTGAWDLIIPVWWRVWLASVCIGWLMVGFLAVLGLPVLIVLLPLAFYQSALGGAMAPVSAAPAWLANVGQIVPFDTLGASYRAVIHGGDFGFAFLWLGATAIAGLALIWLASLRTSAPTQE